MSVKSGTLRNIQSTLSIFIEDNFAAIQRYHTEVEGRTDKIEESDIALRNTDWAGESLIVAGHDYDGEDISYSIPFGFFDDVEGFIQNHKEEKAKREANVARLREISRVKSLRDQVANAQRLLDEAEAAIDPEDLKKVGGTAKR